MSKFLEGEALERFIEACPERHKDQARKSGVRLATPDEFMASLREHLERRDRANPTSE